MDEVTDIYIDLYKLQLNYDSLSIEFGKENLFNKLLNKLKDKNTNLKINSFVNSFLVFAEKQELHDINKITGINIDIAEGKEIYNKITKLVD